MGTSFISVCVTLRLLTDRLIRVSSNRKIYLNNTHASFAHPLISNSQLIVWAFKHVESGVEIISLFLTLDAKQSCIVHCTCQNVIISFANVILKFYGLIYFCRGVSLKPTVSFRFFPFNFKILCKKMENKLFIVHRRLLLKIKTIRILRTVKHSISFICSRSIVLITNFV